MSRSRLTEQMARVNQAVVRVRKQMVFVNKLVLGHNSQTRKDERYIAIHVRQYCVGGSHELLSKYLL